MPVSLSIRKLHFQEYRTVNQDVKYFRLTYLFWWTLRWIGFHWLCWTPWVGISSRGKSFSTEVYEFFVSLGQTRISLKYCDYFFQIFSSLSSTNVQFYHAKTSYTRARLKCGSSWQENKLKLGCVDRYWFMENIKRDFNLWCIGQVMLFYMGAKLVRSHWGRNIDLGCFRIWCWGIYVGLRGTR